MTVCNMSIEAGARAGMIAPDETTFAYLKGRPLRAARAPRGIAAVARWRKLPTDAGARFDREVEIDAATLEPMITYGTHPGMVVPITRHRADGARRCGASTRRSRTWGCNGGEPHAAASRSSRVRRQLHERAARRICAMPRSVLRGRKVAQRRAHAGGARLAAGQARSRSRRARPGVHRRRRRVARVGLLDVHRHERRPGRSRASTRSAPAIATSKAARATGARTLLASPRPPPPPRSAARIADPRELLVEV